MHVGSFVVVVVVVVVGVGGGCVGGGDGDDVGVDGHANVSPIIVRTSSANFIIFITFLVMQVACCIRFLVVSCLRQLLTS